MPSAARQNAGLAQRVSGRMTKGRSKMTTMREVPLGWGHVSLCFLHDPVDPFQLL